MATAPEKTDPLEIKTVALKVSIHCEGCKKKVKKVLQRVEGVGNIDIDSKQNKVMVTGSASVESLIQKLAKYGKQAEIWPEIKPSAAAGKFSGEVKVEGKEKDSVVSTAITTPPETEQQQQQQKLITEKKQAAEEAKLAPPTPAETTKTDSSGEVSGSKDSIEPAKSEKPDSAADLENSEKKGEKVEMAGDKSAVISEEPAARTAAVNPAMPQPFPAHPPSSSYIMSYNTVRPSISYSHYVPSGAIPSSYTTYSGIPPLAELPSSYATYSNHLSMPSSYTTYSSYASVPAYPPENFSTDSYYGSMEAPAPAEGSYDMFNDENPNACNLM